MKGRRKKRHKNGRKILAQKTLKEERIEKGERRLIVCRYIKANRLAGNKKLEFFMRQSC